MKVVAGTHCGNVRPINEDACLALPEYGLVLVADGMGGHQAGEVASDMAKEAIRASVTKAAGKEISVKTAVTWVRRANKAIFQAANEDLSRSGMGTTLTFAYIMKGHAMIAHVGDSRCYLIHDGEIRQVTRDHSLVAELMASGEITPEQAKNHPYRNVITRALGTDSTVAVDALDVDCVDGDVLLLCSDGLSNYLEEYELLTAVETMPDDELCEHLIDIALQRGGRDNITVAAAFIGKEVTA